MELPYALPILMAMGAATVTIVTGLSKFFGHLVRIRREAKAAKAVPPAPVATLVAEAAPAPPVVPPVAEPEAPLPRDIAQGVVTGSAQPDVPVTPQPAARFDNLPAPLSPIVGRDVEAAAVERLLLQDDVRLVTLTGPGGIGKTRLAIEVARRLIGRFEHGAAFVSVGTQRDPEMVPTLIANTLGLRDSGEAPKLETLIAFLREKRLLLVFDNFEAVIAAGPMLTDLLSACPGVKALVTSRAVLRVRGEHQFGLTTLEPPARGPVPPLPELARNGAVAVFLNKAQAVQPGFALTTENAAFVAEICRRVEGLPLSLELAAARVKLLSPKLILERLDSRLKLLTGGSTEVTRQQTLRDTISWSYDLLDEGEQRLFRRLAVFVGGFTLEAAEFVAGQVEAGGRNFEYDVLNGVSSLIDKSLLLQLGYETLPRFQMMETLREFSLDWLRESGEADLIRNRHAAYVLSLTSAAEPGLHGADQGTWMRRIEDEIHNLRSALFWCQDGGDPQTGMQIVGTTRWFWSLRGWTGEGRRLSERALAVADPADRGPARAKALLALGEHTLMQGEYGKARPVLEESIRLMRANGDDEGLGEALGFLGNVMESSEDPEVSQKLYDESLAIRRRINDAWGLEHVLLSLGLRCMGRNDFEQARVHFQEAFDNSKRSGHTWGSTHALNYLGDVARCQNRDEDAEAMYNQALAAFRAEGQEGPIPGVLHNLGHVASHQRDYEKALSYFRQSLAVFQEQADRRGIAECLAGIAGVAGRQDKPHRAALLFGASEALLEHSGVTMWPSNLPDYRRNVAHARSETDEAEFIEAWQEGRSLTLDQALNLAHAR